MATKTTLPLVPVLSPQAINLYLTVFNAFCLVGWSYIFVKAIGALLLSSEQSFYDQVGPSLFYFETFAAFEVVHAIIGIINSSLSANIIQGEYMYIRVYLCFQKVFCAIYLTTRRETNYDF